MDRYAKVLATNVASLLHDSRLTQSEFAEKIGITRSSLNRLIKEQVENPTIRTLERIGEPFGKDIFWLLTDHHPEDGQAKPSLVPPVQQELVALVRSLNEREAAFVAPNLRELVRSAKTLLKDSEKDKKPAKS